MARLQNGSGSPTRSSRLRTRSSTSRSSPTPTSARRCLWAPSTCGGPRQRASAPTRWPRCRRTATSGLVISSSRSHAVTGRGSARPRSLQPPSGTGRAATSTGRVFVSRNADAEPASAVTFTRIDNLAANDPNRSVSSIYPDPANANHAWISYTGFNAATPSTPGHVFEVTYNPVAGTATWTSNDGSTGPLGDIPVTDLVRDDNTGDLYAASDYGVMALASGSATWTLAAPGMPNVEVAGLTIVPNARKLYAATHGMGAWVLGLP